MMGHMDGEMSLDPKPKSEMVNGSKVMNDQGQPMEGGAQGGSGALGAAQSNPTGGAGGDAMEIDSRSNGRGQTAEQIKAQEQKIKETVTGLWSKKA